jgi:chromosome segregation ATPase
MNPRTALILAGLALVVGVVGLVIGISAKNGNKSDQDIADATKAQLEQQLGTTASQVQGAQKEQAAKQAGVTASVNKQLHTLRTSVDAIQNSVNTLNTTSASQGTSIKNLQDDVNKLDTKVSNLGG